MSKIFIQIGSYRDPELLPTLDCLLKTAKYPENLTFGIVWQRNIKDAWDNLDPYLNDKRFRILDVKYDESGGMGWARSETQKLYDGETYTLQIDGHMRFAQDWDKKLLDNMEYLHKISSKPILTGYAFQYDPSNDKDLKPIASTLRPIDFKSNGILFFKSFANKPNEYHKPYRARLVGGHLLFTVGQHCKEYAYDPQLYYAGDELMLSVRSYTLGYDLFHPHENFIWHYYKRSAAQKHWTDIDIDTMNDKESYNIKRIQQMLGQADYGIDLGNYGLGQQRSLQDYEKYSGIYLTSKRVLKSAMIGIEPPVKYKNKYIHDQDFVKSFDLSVKDFQRSFILNFHKNQPLTKIAIDFIALDRSVLLSKNLNIDYIQKNEVIRLIYNGEKKPMGFNLKCYNTTSKDAKINISKSLEPDTQWV
jgi:hypothetical protein